MGIGLNWRAAAKVIADDWREGEASYRGDWQGLKQEMRNSAVRGVKSYFMPLRAVAALFSLPKPATPPVK